MSGGPRPDRGQGPQSCAPLSACALRWGRSQFKTGPRAAAGVESSLRVTHCRQILQSLPEHNYAVLSYLVDFLHEVRG